MKPPRPSTPMPASDTPNEAPPLRPLSLPSLQPTLVFSAADVKAMTDAPSPATQLDLVAPAHAPGTLVLTPEELAQFRADGGEPRSNGDVVTRAPGTLVLTPEELAQFRADGGVQEQTSTTAPRAGQAARLVLFGALGLVVLGLLGLGAIRLLVATRRSWIAPTVLSKSDPRTLQVATTLEQETARAGELALKRKQTLVRLEDLERSLALEAGFRSSFEAALKSDLLKQRAEVRRLQKLVEDRDAASSDASDARRDELDAMLSSARRRIRLLEGALASGRPSNYDALALRREYDLSRIASDKAAAEKVALAGALAEIDQAIHQNEALLAKIESSPYRLAIEHDVTLGFVPYENMSNVHVGQPLLKCRLGTLSCTRVGELDAILPGEVRGANPSTGADARGQLVKLTLTTPEVATTPILFAAQP